MVRASFKHGLSSLPQGDRLGVEFATAAHRNCLAGVGLLTPDEELRSDRAFRGRDVLQGLVIDDYFAISVEECCNAKGSTSLAMQRFEKAKDCCEREGLLGSDDKDMKGADSSKAIGGELLYILPLAPGHLDL